jgi:hypothetical protein
MPPTREKLLRDLAPALMEGEEVLDLTYGRICPAARGSSEPGRHNRGHRSTGDSADQEDRRIRFPGLRLWAAFLRGLSY